jgi:hypothetical protein
MNEKPGYNMMAERPGLVDSLTIRTIDVWCRGYLCESIVGVIHSQTSP